MIPQIPPHINRNKAPKRQKNINHGKKPNPATSILPPTAIKSERMPIMQQNAHPLKKPEPQRERHTPLPQNPSHSPRKIPAPV